MNKLSNTTTMLIATIIIVLLIGTVTYEVSFPNIYSNNYLSSRDEEKRSFYYNGNVKNTEDGKSFDFEKFTGKWSLMTIKADKDTKITIDDNTKIDKGTFCIVVLDSDYNVMAKKKELKDNLDKNIEFTVPKSGEYIIRIVGKNASGNFDIKINSSKNISIENKDFFE